MLEFVVTIMFALVSLVGGNVADHYGSPAYQGVDVSYLDGRKLAICDREPDGNNAKARAGDFNGHGMTVTDRDGFAGNCGVATGSRQWRYHKTREEGSGYGPTSFHVGDNVEPTLGEPEGIPEGLPLEEDPTATEDGELITDTESGTVAND